MAKRKRSRVGMKIKHLMSEGKSQEQSVAMAMNMQRKHRLTPEGGYRRVGRKRSRRRSKKS